MNNKIIYVLLSLLPFLLANCHQKEVEKPLVDDKPPVPVKVQVVEADKGYTYFMASGKVEAATTVNVSTRMMGYVEKVNAKVGDRVRKGQLLLRINDTELIAKRAQVEANIKQAEVAFANAEKDYLRFKALFESQSATQKELDDITTQYNLAKSGIEAARQMKNEINAQFSYTNIKAPISGVVTNKLINAGDIANPGMPLLEIETAGELQVVVSVPEINIAKVKLNDEVEIQVKSLGIATKGKISEIASSAKYTGGQYLVKIDLPVKPDKLLSGMYSVVKFPVDQVTSDSSIYIPISALVTQGQLSGVYTVSQSNTALLRWLRLGKTKGDLVEVLSGLAPGEELILSGESKLYNGVKITR